MRKQVIALRMAIIHYTLFIIKLTQVSDLASAP